MLGVFGAGVVTALQEANLYPRIHSIYASLAGAHDAAYFLCKKTRAGSSIYYEDLTNGRFIRPKAVFGYLIDVALARFARGHSIREFINLDYLAHVEEAGFIV